MPTATIRVTRSNRSELLVEQLAARLQKTPNDPFSPELILVQGRGMGVWLNMQLSQLLGICSHIDYVYPRHFVERAFASVLDEAKPDAATLPALLSSPQEHRPGKNQFTREKMLWGILEQLRAPLESTPDSPITRYLSPDPEGVKAYGLARQISLCFDEYLTFRTDMLRNWAETSSQATSQLGLFGSSRVPNAESWQQPLFNHLEQRLGDRHTATLEKRFLNALHRRKPGSRSLSRLPARLSIFGLSVLPPLYLRVLAALAPHVEIEIFQLSPTRHYFGDLANINKKKELSSAQDNRLLLTYGKLGAEMQQSQALELEAAQVAEEEEALYEPSPAQTLLARVQNDVLEHQNPTSDAPGIDSRTDRSLLFSSCHSVMREVEVLHGQLLELLHAEPGVGPQDILVMMPNVEDYAPVIDAVFGRSRQDPLFVPYRIADRGLLGTSVVADALLRILKLVGGRATAPEVLDLLALNPVRKRHGISAQDLDQLTEWVAQSGVRWGWDADTKAQHDLPAVVENTWQFGLDRLLLGYAVDAGGEACTAGVLPFAELEGKEALLLGKLCSFVAQLRDTCRHLASPRDPAGWQKSLLSALELFTLTEEDNAWEQQDVHAVLDDIATEASSTDFVLPLSVSVVRRILTQRLADKPRVGSFLSGGVTMCTLTPMRSIPFKVVVLLGMNEGAFPRQAHPADFNLVHSPDSTRRPGDPDRQQDDRYLFLEALLAARDRLLISYVGQSIRDNATLAPSIVVSELQEYVKEHYSGSARLGDQGHFLDQLIVQHPLQPFSPRYFDQTDPRLFSYEKAYLGAAHALRKPHASSSALVTSPIPIVSESRSYSLKELIEFLGSPAKFFLRHTLGINLDRDAPQLQELDPVALEPLERYQIGDRALAWLEAGASEAEVARSLRATGLVTHGTPGTIDIETAMKTARPIAAQLSRLKESPLPPYHFVVHPTPKRDSGELKGSLHSLYERGQVLGQFARVKGKALIRAWVQHLALSACALPQQDTWLLGRDAQNKQPYVVKRFTAVDAPLTHLKNLLTLLEQGTSAPVPFFPDASLIFTQAILKQKEPSDALKQADKAFADTLSYSASLRRLYGETPSLDRLESTLGGARFQECSLQVFEPLLQHLSDGE